MEPNQAAPVPVEYRYYGDIKPKPVGALAITASVLVGLAALLHTLLAIGAASGLTQLPVAFARLYLLTLGGAGVVFVVWLWRARSNAEVIAGPQTQRLGKGWTIGAWICPVVNMWFPYRIVVDVWRASAPNRDGGGLVLAWWLTFVAMAVYTQLLRYDNTFSFILIGAVDLVVAALAIMVIRRITAWQSLTRA